MKRAWLIELRGTFPVLYYVERNPSNSVYTFTTDANLALKFITGVAAKNHAMDTNIDNMLVCAEHCFED
jgi:hypothetical protein